MGLAAIAMVPPVVVAAQAGQFATARAFFYSAGLVMTLVVMVAIALQGYKAQNVSRFPSYHSDRILSGIADPFCISFFASGRKHELSKRIFRNVIGIFDNGGYNI